ncbi:MAG: sialate O-acetylesterase [Planctomycetes bacterium]|nr:sialate O-acetylesterase [Planctomycetota bacterium]
MLITSGIRDGQVLQRTARGAKAALAGTCAGSGAVTVAVSAGSAPLRGWKKRAVGRASAGTFRAVLNGLPSGGPYRVTVSVGTERVTVRDVFVGDVWILGGQSNMEGIGNLDRAARPHRLVRCCYMDGHWGQAKDPLHHLDESPDLVHNPGQVSAAKAAATRASRIKGTGVGVTFGTELVKRTGVPQGLICVAHGGTSMTQWDPAKADQGGASLYGSMLRSVRATGQPVAGLAWYQGESDANPDAEVRFTERMQAFVQAVRRDFGARLPVVMVQIGRHLAALDESAHRAWNSIQEQQRLLAAAIGRLACVSAVDLPLDDGIHISGEGCQRLGVRLARQAARIAHGDRSEAAPPEPVSARVLSPREWPICPRAYEVRFRHVVGGLRAHGEPEGFALIDDTGRDLQAIYKTVLDGDRAIIETTLDGTPPRMRLVYAPTRWPRATLLDGRDLPVPAFGPFAIGGQLPSTPFATAWRYSGIRPGDALDGVSQPTVQEISNWPIHRSGMIGFMDMHPHWSGHAGHARFSTALVLDEDMRLTVRFGYDGPFCLWIDGEEVARDPSGTNPAIPDRHEVERAMRRGAHRISVAMALNGGLAWGFALRCVRGDLADAAVARGDYLLPRFDPEAVT